MQVEGSSGTFLSHSAVSIDSYRIASSQSGYCSYISFGIGSYTAKGSLSITSRCVCAALTSTDALCVGIDIKNAAAALRIRAAAAEGIISDKSRNIFAVAMPAADLVHRFMIGVLPAFMADSARTGWAAIAVAAYRSAPSANVTHRASDIFTALVCEPNRRSSVTGSAATKARLIVTSRRT